MQLANKSVTAKLLATENITVVQDKVRTASFDIKQRILTLPMWADTESYVEDHLIGHEVAHALYTPLEGWHESVSDKGQAYKSFLNVVEDARIEKLIQRKYPGLRPLFIKSYRKLLKDGFFGSDLRAINKMKLIDRINTYFKCGETAGVRFDASERVWLDEIAQLETWEQVVELTDRLFGFAKEQAEKEQEVMETAIVSGEGGEDEEEGEEGFAEDQDGDEEEDAFDQLFGDEEELSDDDFVDNSAGAGPADPMESETDRELRDAIDRELNQNFEGNVYNLRMPKVRWQDHVIPFRDILKDVCLEKPVGNKTFGHDHVFKDLEEAGGICYDRWRTINMKAVNHMVKEFEMRKSASEYARASLAKTGVIDTVKMNNYKLTDDIFRKVTVVPDGKNHGFIMYLDMSGSMHDYMYETVEQTLLLVHFARQIGVPFRVYGFTDALAGRFGQSTYRYYGEAPEDAPVNQLMVPAHVKLLELFSDRMSKAHMTLMSKALLAAYLTRNNYWDIFANCDFRPSLGHCQAKIFQLGGTPLDASIAIGIPLAQDFREENRIDVLNTIFLTDGASHEMPFCSSEGRLECSGFATHRSFMTISLANKTYRVKGRQDITPTLMTIYADATGSKNIGYRIIPNGPNALFRELRYINNGSYIESLDEIRKSWSREGYHTTSAKGVDEQFLLSIKSLRIQDTNVEVESGASKAKIRSAFKKGLGQGKKSRKMLVDLVKRVA